MTSVVFVGWLMVCVSLAAVPAFAQTEDISKFAGLARIFRDLSATASQPEAGRLFDFELVIAAVTAQPGFAGHSMLEYGEAFAGRLPIAIPVAGGAASRDDTAYKLYGLGYSAKEIADILSGRITRSALDTAQKMLMLGRSERQASDFIDKEYQRLAAARERAAQERERLARKQPAAPPAIASASGFESDVARFSAQHGVDPLLVRAVIACESGWNPSAVSPVGALGLMQLMPGTARELGVDPLDPRQNVEGGVRYLAGLLRIFKTTEQALVAYNAGPGFALRYARGQAALYGETREFVRRVLELAR